jgi:hypothetical protein
MSFTGTPVLFGDTVHILRQSPLRRRGMVQCICRITFSEVLAQHVAVQHAINSQVCARCIGITTDTLHKVVLVIYTMDNGTRAMREGDIVTRVERSFLVGQGKIHREDMENRKMSTVEVRQKRLEEERRVWPPWSYHLSRNDSRALVSIIYPVSI